MSNTAISPELVKENPIPEASLCFNGSLECGSVACEAVRLENDRLNYRVQGHLFTSH